MDEIKDIVESAFNQYKINERIDELEDDDDEDGEHEELDEQVLLTEGFKDKVFDVTKMSVLSVMRLFQLIKLDRKSGQGDEFTINGYSTTPNDVKIVDNLDVGEIAKTGGVFKIGEFKTKVKDAIKTISVQASLSNNKVMIYTTK